jgi:MoxR-like ATPase
MIENVTEFSDLKKLSDNIVSEVGKTIIGLDNYVKILTFCLLSGGHVLLDGLPGTAKTALALSFSNSLDIGVNRIQSTPDMMPGDVTGTRIYNPKTLEFEFRPGPIFSNLVIVDEINRAPPRSQAALLEAMQEGQVTVDGVTSILDPPFMIIATKNPLEYEGTFPLSPTQLDRFMCKLNLTYPSKNNEILVLKTKVNPNVNLSPVISKSALNQAKALINKVSINDDISSIIAKIVRSTREMQSITLGASPTASVSLLSAARGYAAVVHGRDHVTIDDVKDVSFDVLNHRLILPQSDISSNEQINSDEQKKQLLEQIIVKFEG